MLMLKATGAEKRRTIRVRRRICNRLEQMSSKRCCCREMMERISKTTTRVERHPMSHRAVVVAVVKMNQAVTMNRVNLKSSSSSRVMLAMRSKTRVRARMRVRL